MNEVPHPRVRIYRYGVRLLAAGMLVASVAAVASVIRNVPFGDSSSSPPPTSVRPGPWGVSQPGYHRISAPLPKALHALPVRVRLPRSAGVPAGVYRGAGSARVRYTGTSRYGLYLVTVWPASRGVKPSGIRALAKGCHVCTRNRLIGLVPGVRAAIAVGGGHASTITWRQGSRTFQVRGPAASFTSTKAVAAAKAIARANR
ncbi:MAG TPA: hypothetical protein VFX13_14755 [Gaiellales bacterium]|nr:hypothetical protein [Gaiellales bacterium]